MTELHTRRLDAVIQCLATLHVRSVADLGCGEGNLLFSLATRGNFERLAGVDISISTLKKATVALDALDAIKRPALFHADYTEPMRELVGCEAVCLIETIEHLEPSRLAALERATFAFLSPKFVIVTTPNKEYNPVHGVPSHRFRHPDHKFEWTRAKFVNWASALASRYSYDVDFENIGDLHAVYGSSTQMAVFRRES